MFKSVIHLPIINIFFKERFWYTNFVQFYSQIYFVITRAYVKSSDIFAKWFINFVSRKYANKFVMDEKET